MKKALIVLAIAVLVYLYFLNHSALNKKPKIILVDFLPFNFHALTIPPFGIFIKREQQHNKDLIDHEMIHWGQYQKMGLAGYHFTYLKEILTYGYDAMPMEIQARICENDFCRMHYTQCVRDGSARTISDPLFRS